MLSSSQDTFFSYKRWITCYRNHIIRMLGYVADFFELEIAITMLALIQLICRTLLNRYKLHEPTEELRDPTDSTDKHNNNENVLLISILRDLKVFSRTQQLSSNIIKHLPTEDFESHLKNNWLLLSEKTKRRKHNIGKSKAWPIPRQHEQNRKIVTFPIDM